MTKPAGSAAPLSTPEAVRRKALALLERRDYGTAELTEKLVEKGAERADAEAAAARMVEYGFINDENYAAMVARHYAAKGYGPSRIREELYRRGVPRDCWEEALESLEGPEEAIDGFLRKKLRGADLTDPKSYQRAANALARRGFRWDDIKDGLRRYGADTEEED